MKAIKCKTGETAKTYKEYLNTKHWHDLRIRFFNSSVSRGHCFFCKSTKVQLHHKTYRNLGDEHLSDLVEVCYKHHKAIHKSGLKLKKKYRKRKKRKLSNRLTKKRIVKLKPTKILVSTVVLRRRNELICYTERIENGLVVKVYETPVSGSKMVK